MDYKKKYEQALERCKKEFNFNNLAYSHEEIKQKLERVFPELNDDERIKKEIIEYLEQSQFGEEHYQVDDDIVRGYIAWLEKQDEQKPICKLDNSYTCVKFPFKAKVKSTGTIVTIYDGQLGPDGKKWIKYQSDLKDGYNVYEPDNLELVCEIEQKLAWSGEDERLLKLSLENLAELKNRFGEKYGRVGECICWLKSLKERMKGE